jgi:glutamate racemase
MFIDPIELLVLGCTHFPCLEEAIRDVFGRKAELLDPAHAVACEVALHCAEPIGSEPSDPGETRFMTTGDVRMFEKNIKMLIGPLREGDPRRVAMFSAVRECQSSLLDHQARSSR